MLQRTENGKQSPGEVEEATVQTLMVLLFFFAFFCGPWGRIVYKFYLRNV